MEPAPRPRDTGNRRARAWAVPAAVGSGAGKRLKQGRELVEALSLREALRWREAWRRREALRRREARRRCEARRAGARVVRSSELAEGPAAERLESAATPPGVGSPAGAPNAATPASGPVANGGGGYSGGIDAPGPAKGTPAAEPSGAGGPTRRRAWPTRCGTLRNILAGPCDVHGQLHVTRPCWIPRVIELRSMPPVLPAGRSAGVGEGAGRVGVEGDGVVVGRAEAWAVERAWSIRWVRADAWEWGDAWARACWRSSRRKRASSTSRHPLAWSAGAEGCSGTAAAPAAAPVAMTCRSRPTRRLRRTRKSPSASSRLRAPCALAASRMLGRNIGGGAGPRLCGTVRSARNRRSRDARLTFSPAAIQCPSNAVTAVTVRVFFLDGRWKRA